MPVPEDKQIVTAFSHEGGYVIVTADGAVYCFNCEHRGGLIWRDGTWVLR